MINLFVSLAIGFFTSAPINSRGVLVIFESYYRYHSGDSKLGCGSTVTPICVSDAF